MKGGLKIRRKTITEIQVYHLVTHDSSCNLWKWNLGVSSTWCGFVWGAQLWTTPRLFPRTSSSLIPLGWKLLTERSSLAWAAWTVLWSSRLTSGWGSFVSKLHALRCPLSPETTSTGPNDILHKTVNSILSVHTQEVKGAKLRLCKHTPGCQDLLKDVYSLTYPSP